VFVCTSSTIYNNNNITCMGSCKAILYWKTLLKMPIRPDLLLLQEHRLTPANLNKFDKYFPEYFSFGSSAMSNCVAAGMLRGRPFGGVMALINKRLRKVVETVYCDERFVIVRVANYIVINVYLLSAGSSDRLFIGDEVLTNIFVQCERFYECELIIGGDFNVNLDTRM